MRLSNPTIHTTNTDYILEKVFKDTQLSANNINIWCMFSCTTNSRFFLLLLPSYFAQSVDYESVFVYKFVLINMYSNNVILKSMLTGWDVNSIRFLRSKRKTFYLLTSMFSEGHQFNLYSVLCYFYTEIPTILLLVFYIIIKVIKPQYLLWRYRCVMLRNLWEQPGYRQNTHRVWKIQA